MPPLPGHPTVGSGIRAFANGEGLRARGHRVTYVTRAEDLPPERVGEDSVPPSTGGLAPLPLPDSLSSLPGLASPGGPPGAPGNPYGFSEGNDLLRLVRRLSPDVVLVEQFEEARKLQGEDIPIVLDMFAPRILESQFQGPEADQEMIRTLDALGCGDFFLFSNERQKLFYLSLLALSGVDCTHAPVGVVRVSCPPELPSFHKPQSPVLVCGGVFWPWADLRPGLSILQDHLEKRRRGRIEVFGGGYGIRSFTTALADPRDSLPPSRRVRYRGMVPIDSLFDAYRRSSIAFDVMAPNSEREMNLSFRQIDYLRAGLPILTANFQEIATDLVEYGAGWVVDPRDERSIRDVLDLVLDNPDVVMKASLAAQHLAREQFRWDLTIEPLDAFCRNPRKRARRPNVLIAMSKVTTDLWAEHEELPRLQAALEDQQQVNVKKTEELGDLNRQIWKLIDSVDRMSLSVEEVTRFKSDAIRYLGEEEDRAIRSAEELARELERRNLDLLKKEHALRAAQDDIDRMKSGISSLQGNLERTQEVLFERERGVAELRAEKDRLLLALTDARTEARDLAADRAKKTEEMAGFEERLELARGRAEAQLAEQEGRFLSRLETAEHRARAVLDELRVRLQFAVEEKEEARHAAATAQSEVLANRRDIEKKSKEIELLEDRIREERSRSESALGEAHALFSSRIDGADAEARAVLETLRQRLLAVDADRHAQKVKLEGTEKGVQELKGELNRRAAELRAERQERREEQRSHEAVRGRLETDFLARLERAEGEARVMVEGLHDQVARLRAEKTALQSHLEKAEQAIPDLRRDLRKKTVEIQQIVREKETLQRDAAAALAQVETHFSGLLDAAAARADAVWAEMRSRIQSLQDEGNGARDQLSRTEVVVQELKRELQKRHAEARDLRIEMRQEKRRFAEESTAIREEAAREAEEQAARLQEQLEAARDEAVRAKAQKEGVQTRMDRLEAEVPALRRDLQKKNQELRELEMALRSERGDRARALGELEDSFVHRLRVAEEDAVASMASLLAQLREQLEAAKDEASRAKSQREAVQLRMDRVEVEVPALRRDLQKKNQELRELDLALRAERGDRARALAEVEASFIHRLQVAEGEAVASMGGLLDARDRLEVEAQIAREEKVRLKERIAVLDADIRKKSAEIAAAVYRERHLVSEHEARIQALIREQKIAQDPPVPPANGPVTEASPAAPSPPEQPGSPEPPPPVGIALEPKETPSHPRTRSPRRR